MVKAELEGTEVHVSGKKSIDKVYKEQYFGKIIEDKLILSLTEAMYLISKEKLSLYHKGNKADEKKAFKLFCDIDAEFPHKYRVYADLRERGYIVKSGFKFGTHFRVYPRGVNPYKDGPKSQKEHTKWVVHAVPEDYLLSYAEMSRAVRLAQNIRAKMLWAVVDSEEGVTYYEFLRITP